MVTDLLLVKLVHKHLNNDIEIINGLESVHPQKCMDKSKHNCSFWHLGSPSYGLQSLFTFAAAWGNTFKEAMKLATSSWAHSCSTRMVVVVVVVVVLVVTDTLRCVLPEPVAQATVGAAAGSIVAVDSPAILVAARSPWDPWETGNYSSRSLHTSIRIGFYISLSNCTHRSWWCLPRQAGFGAAGCSCRGWRWRRGSRRRAARNWWWSGRTEADTGQHGVFRTLHLAHLDTARIAPMKDRASESPPVWQLCSFFPEQWVLCISGINKIMDWQTTTSSRILTIHYQCTKLSCLW